MPRKNKEERLAFSREYYQKNKEKMKKDSKKRREKHRDEALEYAKKYYQENKEKLKTAAKIYRQEHKQERREQQKEKRKLISNKLRHNVSSLIRMALLKNNNSKARKSVLKYLSYSMQELKEHLEQQFESWMTWNNWGIYSKKTWNDKDQSTWTWQIDHIIPHSTFKYISMEDEEFKKCWAFDNLRPYSAKLNSIEGANRIRH